MNWLLYLRSPGRNWGEDCRGILFSAYKILLEFRRERKRFELRLRSAYPLGDRMGAGRRLACVKYVGEGSRGPIAKLLGVEKPPEQLVECKNPKPRTLTKTGKMEAPKITGSCGVDTSSLIRSQSSNPRAPFFVYIRRYRTVAIPRRSCLARRIFIRNSPRAVRTGSLAPQGARL